MGKTSPPSFLLRLLKWFCKPAYHQDIEGDLLELYERRLQQMGVRKAKWKLAKDILLLFRPGMLRGIKLPSPLYLGPLLKHTLLLTFRTSRRYKSATFINLVGLSSGLACALLIYLWVYDEMQVDGFHEQDQRLYQVMLNQEEASDVITTNLSPGRLLSETLPQDFPEIEKAVMSTDPSWSITFNLTSEEKKLKTIGKFVGEDYFELFYGLTLGQAEQVLVDKASVVISERLATKLFGSSANAIGKTVDWQVLSIKQQGIISGVFKESPANSTDQFDLAVSFDHYGTLVGPPNWANIYESVTYVLLAENHQIQSLQNNLKLYLSQQATSMDAQLFVQKYSNHYLFGDYEQGVQAGGRITYVRIFSLIAFFVLLIACINFMNLSTARSARRMKEVGIKKSVGAKRSSLIFQYLGESVILAFASLGLALIMVQLVLPQFNEITHKQLEFSYSAQIGWTILAITLFTGLVSGSYPALYLSAFQPVAILKGRLTGLGGEIWIRKGLVVFQFSLSIILLVSVFVLYSQSHFIQTKNLGFEKEQLIYLENEGKLTDNLEAFINGLTQIPGILKASASTTSVVNNGVTETLSWPENPTNEIPFGRSTGYYDLIETLGVPLLAGRSFSREFANEQQKIVVNESAVAIMKLDQPLGKQLRFRGQEVEIIGVVKDFHFQSLHEAVGPMFFHFDPRFLTGILVKLEAGSEKRSLAGLEEFYQSFNPGYAFEYTYLDEIYQAEYEAESRVSILARYFAGIAMLISCLGLFGLATFSAERRMKEIGIRKILGSSVWEIVQLLGKEFSLMLLIACLISLPISYQLAKNWLDGFAYRIDLTWWIFAAAAAFAFVIAGLTVGIQTLKAARINPVLCLRDE